MLADLRYDIPLGISNNNSYIAEFTPEVVIIFVLILY